MALLPDLPLWQLLLCILGTFLGFGLLRATHNCFFHPLSNIPGPWLRAAFFFPYYWEIWTGDSAYNLTEIHERYGNVVRVSPNTVSVIDADGWREIYGSATKKPLPKDPDFYSAPKSRASHIFMADDADHTRMRQLLNPAFSGQALRNQESTINSYIDVLIQKLLKEAESNLPVDLVRWLNFTTFDLIEDFCFGESFGALENEDCNLWIANIFRWVKVGRMLLVCKGYPIIGVPIMGLLTLFPGLLDAMKKHRQYTVDKITRRMCAGTDGKDLMSYILKRNDKEGMSKEEIVENCGVMVMAGSETTATHLSGAFYLLLKNHEWYNKLRDELLGAFHDESEIAFAPLGQLKILSAVIRETFRMYPPVATALPRLTTRDGAMVCGHLIPPNVRIGVPHYVAYRSPRNFRNPNRFAPERFLGDPEYIQDKRNTIQPFSVGPRNCIGQNVALAKIRIMIARLVFNFDMKLQKESLNWDRQKVFIVLDKRRLMVRLRARSGANLTASGVEQSRVCGKGP